MNSAKKNKKSRNRCEIIFLLLLFQFLFIVAHSQSLTAYAGSASSVCPGDSVRLGGSPSASGGNPPYTYSWQPAAGLTNPASANPYAYPTANTTYTLTVTDASSNTAKATLQITVLEAPDLEIGNDTTINSGQVVQLYASGADKYFWTPTQWIYHQNTATPWAEPQDTTEFCVVGIGKNGCAATACMMVYVIPDEHLVFYNSFTPNNDGNNDYFHIGNLYQYPDNEIKIFSRIGKLVYQASPYQNNWDGKTGGQELPCATYYFIFTPGNGKPALKGSVTIIR